MRKDDSPFIRQREHQVTPPISAIATLIELALQSSDPRLVITSVLASNEWLRAQELLHALQHIDPAVLKEAHERAVACAELQRQQLH